MKNKIFITGGAGTIGSSFIKKYYDKYDFVSYCRNEKFQVSLKRSFDRVEIILGDIENLPYKKSFFQNVLSFHLFMHLENNQLKDILDNVSNISQEDGLFIFDIPSRKRRKLTGYQTSSWHGGNQISVKEIKELIKEKWELISYHGVAFFPIHLLPKKIRM